MTEEVKLSRADFDGVKTKYDRRVEVMRRNIEASKRIQAAKILKKHQDDQVVIEAAAEAIMKIKNGNIDTEIFSKLYDDRIAEIDKRIKSLYDEKERNNGFLKASRKNRLEQYLKDKELLVKEKKEFLKKSKATPTPEPVKTSELVVAEGNE